MNNNIDFNKIKDEGKGLIEAGYKPSEVVTMLYLKYKSDFKDRRTFESKFGRYFRRCNKVTLNVIKNNCEPEKPQEPEYDSSELKIHDKITTEKNADGTGVLELKIRSSKASTMSDEEILERGGFNPETYKVVSMRKSEWDAQTKHEGIVKMSSFRLNVAPKKAEDVDVALSLERKFKNTKKPIIFPKKKEGEGDEIAVVAIPDLHLGKFAEKHTCGYTYNTTKAELAFYQVMSQAVHEIEHRNVDKIVFFWSQDFFHYDTPSITTTAGTRQDTDIGYQKLFDTGLSLLIDGVTMLAKIAPVETFYVPSNHDEMTGYHAASALSVMFKDCPNITVDLSAEPRHYILYGVNLMGFAHGDKEGKRIEGLMQYEEPEKWGKSHFREFFMGHFHSLHQYEKNGIVFRYLQSPTGTDAWHNRSGFIGAQKCGQLFIRNKYYGPVLEKQLFVLEDKLDAKTEAQAQALSA